MCNFFHKYATLNQVHYVNVHEYWSSPELWDHKYSNIFCFICAVEWWIFFSQLTCFGNTVVSFCVIHSKIRFLVGGLGLWKKQRNHPNCYLLANCKSPLRTSYRLVILALGNSVLYIIYYRASVSVSGIVIQRDLNTKVWTASLWAGILRGMAK